MWKLQNFTEKKLLNFRSIRNKPSDHSNLMWSSPPSPEAPQCVMFVQITHRIDNFPFCFNAQPVDLRSEHALTCCHLVFVQTCHNVIIACVVCKEIYNFFPPGEYYMLPHDSIIMNLVISPTVRVKPLFYSSNYISLPIFKIPLGLFFLFSWITLPAAL